MSRDPMDPRPGGADETVTRLLREMFAPPADRTYWSRLESSIMTRVSGDPHSPVTGDPRESWWTVVAGWVPAGLAAAALALLAAGFALMQDRASERQIAYEQAMRGSAPVSVQTLVRPSTMSEREATLQVVLSY